MSLKKNCIVVIPVYKQLNNNDKLSIRQAIKMTLGTDIVFIMPQSLNVDSSFSEFEDVAIERFEDSFYG